MKSILYIASDDKKFVEGVSRLFLESAAKAVGDKKRFSVSLSGGGTPKKVYAHLATPYFKNRLPWSGMDFFWGDERCVPSDHQDSNYRMVREALFSKVTLSEKQIFRMKGEMEKPVEAARAYESELKAHFHLTKSPPQMDWVFLGIGEDGHIASLFPGTTGIHENQHWVISNFIEKLSSHRLSMTFPVFNNARKVVFLCSGTSKSHIVREMFREDISHNRYPAQRVKPVNGELVWFLDAAAATKLPLSIKEKAQYV